MSAKLTEQILGYAATLPEGTPINAKALLHLGNRAAIDQVLSRLARSGKLFRVQRGVFALPVQTKFGLRAPSVPALVQHLAETTGETIAPGEAAAANKVGLTTQVPVRPVYLTSGRTRRLQVGAQTVELRHAPQWKLVFPNEPAGTAIRALTWLRKTGQEGMRNSVVETLPPNEKQKLFEARGRLPEWLAEELSEFVARG